MSLTLMLAALVRALPQSNVARTVNRSPLLVSRLGMGAMWLCFNDKVQLRPKVHLPFTPSLHFVGAIYLPDHPVKLSFARKRGLQLFRYRDAI